MNGWVNEWVNEWMIKWTDEWMNEWTNEWMSELLSEWMNEWTSEWMNEWVDEWMSEWTDEWMNGWVNELMNEWMTDWMNNVHARVKICVFFKFYIWTKNCITRCNCLPPTWSLKGVRAWCHLTLCFRSFENVLYDSTDSGLNWIILAYFFVSS